MNISRRMDFIKKYTTSEVNGRKFLFTISGVIADEKYILKDMKPFALELLSKMKLDMNAQFDKVINELKNIDEDTQ